MSTLNVWHPVQKKDVPPNRRLIKSKWVFDVKRTGTFGARLVACGYSQIPGVDFNDTYSPVVNDAVFRIVVILQLLWNLTSVIIDVETAFLHGELNASIYMLAPKGTNLGSHQCVHLDKALYGLVQAARQFYLKFATTLKKLGFTVNYADPCLFYRFTKQGKIILVIHIGDCYVVGDKSVIKTFITELHKHGLKTKVSAGADDYLSCEVVLDQQAKLGWIGQPTLLNKVEKKFGEMANKLGAYNYKTPGSPGFQMIKPDDDKGLLTPAEKTLYRSCVGTLLQFSNKTRPEMSNAVRELTKGMDKAPPAALKEMYQVIKYLLDTKDYGLCVKPKPLNDKNHFNLTIYSDSDWVSDKSGRKSTTGFIIFLQGSPILWKSHSQQTVALSSTEAEYYAMSEAAKEINSLYKYWNHYK